MLSNGGEAGGGSGAALDRACSVMHRGQPASRGPRRLVKKFAQVIALSTPGQSTNKHKQQTCRPSKIRFVL